MAAYRHITAVPPASSARPVTGGPGRFFQTVSGSGPIAAATSVPWRVPWVSTLQGVNVRVGTSDPSSAVYTVLKNNVSVLTVTLTGGQVFVHADCSIPFNGTADEVSVRTPSSTAVGVNIDLLFG